MHWGDVGDATLSALSALAIIAGLAASVAALTRDERLRRRLKTHTEVLTALPPGDDAEKMREIVSRDVQRLHDLAFPDPHSEERRRHEIHDWWVVPLGLTGAVGLIAQGTGHEPAGWFLVVLLTVGGVAFIGATWSRYRWRQALAVRDGNSSTALGRQP